MRRDAVHLRRLVAAALFPCASEAFVLALFPCAAEAFVLSSGGFRWTVPESTSSSDGLGGGLSYVVDDRFCAEMLARFPERDLVYGYEVSALQFVHCADLRNAL